MLGSKASSENSGLGLVDFGRALASELERTAGVASGGAILRPAICYRVEMVCFGIGPALEWLGGAADARLRGVLGNRVRQLSRALVVLGDADPGITPPRGEWGERIGAG